MAKTKLDRELFDTLRARGLRKRVARLIAEAPVKAGNGSLPKPARQAIDDLSKLINDLEKRVSGESATRSRAAKSAAQTRRRNAAKRSQAAKKAAGTRRQRSATAGGTRRRASRSR